MTISEDERNRSPPSRGVIAPNWESLEYNLARYAPVLRKVKNELLMLVICSSTLVRTCVCVCGWDETVGFQLETNRINS